MVVTLPGLINDSMPLPAVVYYWLVNLKEGNQSSFAVLYNSVESLLYTPFDRTFSYSKSISG